MRRVLFFVTLFLGLAAVASAQDDSICSAANLAGQWGYSFSGTIITSAGGVPMGVVGKATIDAAGNFSVTQNSSTAGQVSQNETATGTVTVNSDCTGTMTLSVTDPAGNVLRKAAWTVVFDDNGTEFRAIMTSLQLGDGTNVPAVVTMAGKKVSTSTWVLRLL